MTLKAVDYAEESTSKAAACESKIEASAKGRNRRNGASSKTIQVDSGKLPIQVPRDRDGTFEPILVEKHQRRFIACMDGLTGFPEAIKTAFPQTRVQLCIVQLCIVHLVRAALKYVVDADSREVVRDLKAIYLSATVLEAEENLNKFAEKWDVKYPTIAKQWRAKWEHIILMFDLPPEIRKATYTTNTIESVNSVIRKFTRNRKQYPNRDSALKLIYMAIHEASKKWTMPIPKWKDALNHFAILFEGRMPKNN